MKYKIFMIVSIALLLALTCVTVFAGETETATVEAEAEPKSDVYSILYECWQYILPENVIRDNANLITLLTILATSLVIYVPIFLCVWLLIRRR